MKESGSDGERCWSQASLGRRRSMTGARTSNLAVLSSVGRDRAKPRLEMTLAPRKVVQSYKKNAIAPLVRSCVDLVASYYVRLYHIISQYYIRSSRIVYQ